MSWPSQIVETDVGALALHADDRVMTPFITEHHCWEPDEAAWLRGVLRPGQTVIDCGANVGYFTVLMARAVGTDGAVIAIEPERENLRLLEGNLRRNGCGNVRAVRAAAWEAAGTLALRRNPANAGDHQVHRVGGSDDVLVPCVALDELLAGARVDVIKIDTQGADHHVIAGLRRTLRASPRAQVLVEFWLDGMSDRGIDAEDVLAGYRGLGRPLGLLGERGEVVAASDGEIMAAAAGWEGRFVNLVVGAR